MNREEQIKYAQYIVNNNVIESEEAIRHYSGQTLYTGTSHAKREPHGIPNNIWAEAWANRA